jgi:hypothetical protein
MADGKIVMEFSAKEAQALTALQRMWAGQDAGEKKTKQHAGAWKELGGHISGQVQALAATAAGYLTVNKAIEMVIASLERKAQREKEALGAQIGLAGPQERLLANLRGTPEPQIKHFMESLSALVGKHTPSGGMESAMVEAAMGLSASAMDQAQTLGAMEAAMRYAPASAEAREYLVGATLDLAKVSGSKKPMENLGLVMGILGEARIPDPAKLAKYSMRSIAGSVSYGATVQQAGALFAAVTQASMDPEGRMSAGAVPKFIELLAEKFPEVNRYDYGMNARGQRVRRLQARGVGPKTFEQRLALVAGNPQLLEDVLGEVQGGPAQKAALREFVKGTGPVTGFYRQAIEKLGVPLPELARLAEEDIRIRQGMFAQKAAATQRVIDETVHAAKTDTVAGMTAAIGGTYSPENFEELARAHGMSHFRSVATRFVANLASQSPWGTEAWKYRRQGLVNYAGELAGDPLAEKWRTSTGEPVPVDVELGRKLLEAIDKLDKRTEEQNELLRRQETERRSGAGKAVPVPGVMNAAAAQHNEGYAK